MARIEALPDSLEEVFFAFEERDLALEARVLSALKRVHKIRFFTCLETDPSFLEDQARILTDGVGLPPAPVFFTSDRNEALHFAEEVDENIEWAKAWELQKDATNDMVNTQSAYRKRLWVYARDTSENAAINAERFGRIGIDASNRCRAYAMWESIGDLMEGGNRLEPFVKVYESGSGLLGIADGKFGVYTPPPPRMLT